MRTKNKEGKSSFKIAAIFVVIVVFFILVSGLLKLFLLFSKSRFDSNNQFTFTVFEKESKKAEAISLSPDSKSVFILKISDIDEYNIQKFLGVPIEGKVEANDPNFKLASYSDPSSLSKGLLINYREIQTNLTIIDLIRIFLSTNGISLKSVNTKDVSSKMEESSVNKIVQLYFSDPKISEEKISVQVINATDVAGLGNRLARLITNMGGNVVMVTTAKDTKDVSNISYIDKNSYTLKRLEKILGYKTTLFNGSSVADLIITVGKDSAGKGIF